MQYRGKKNLKYFWRRFRILLNTQTQHKLGVCALFSLLDGTERSLAARLRCQTGRIQQVMFLRGNKNWFMTIWHMILSQQTFSQRLQRFSPALLSVCPCSCWRDAGLSISSSFLKLIRWNSAATVQRLHPLLLFTSQAYQPLSRPLSTQAHRYVLLLIHSVR